jgi:hypothetical protein
MINIDSTIPGLRLEVQNQKASDILSKLQQSGLFRAIVVQSSNQQVLLETAFGRISGKAAQNLQKGDQILARILPGKSELTIKVEQHTPGVVVLPKNIMSKLSNLGISLPALAKIVPRPGDTSALKIADHAFKLAGMGALQQGQRVMLDINSKNQLVAKNLHAQSILKNALSQLIPKNLQNTSAHNLTSLQKLSSEILNLNTQSLSAQANHQPNKTNATTPAPLIQSSSKSTDSMQAAIERLALPLARIQGIKPNSIQQIMTLLSLLKPTASQQASGNTTALPESLTTLLKELNASPEKFEKMIRQLFTNDAANQKQNVSDRSVQMLANTMRQELLAQTEQSLNQVLTQKTTVALQQEQHQPLQLNLNIPVQVENEVRNLKLKISEKRNEGVPEDQSWEIDLTFNFASLGLISTHILLQKNCLSAHFKAEQESTWALINQHLHEFKSQIVNGGFEAGLFDCRHGPIEEVEKNAPLRGGDNFVDVNV